MKNFFIEYKYEGIDFVFTGTKDQCLKKINIMQNSHYDYVLKTPLPIEKKDS